MCADGCDLNAVACLKTHICKGGHACRAKRGGIFADTGDVSWSSAPPAALSLYPSFSLSISLSLSVFSASFFLFYLHPLFSSHCLSLPLLSSLCLTLSLS